jgi:hypothetical protein
MVRILFPPAASRESADSAKVRAAIPFALLLIAGELAKGFGIIPAQASVKEAALL